MGKYLLVIVAVLLFKVWPGYRRYKTGEKNIGYYDMLEGIFFIAIVIIVGLLAHFS